MCPTLLSPLSLSLPCFAFCLCVPFLSFPFAFWVWHTPACCLPVSLFHCVWLAGLLASIHSFIHSFTHSPHTHTHMPCHACPLSPPPLLPPLPLQLPLPSPFTPPCFAACCLPQTINTINQSINQSNPSLPFPLFLLFSFFLSFLAFVSSSSCGSCVVIKHQQACCLPLTPSPCCWPLKTTSKIIHQSIIIHSLPFAFSLFLLHAACLPFALGLCVGWLAALALALL